MFRKTKQKSQTSYEVAKQKRKRTQKRIRTRDENVINHKEEQKELDTQTTNWR